MGKALKTTTCSKLEMAGVKVLLYGTNGSGKTRFAATWPFPVYFTPLMAQNELRSIANEHFPVILFDSMQEVREQTLALGEAIESNKINCKTVVIDNLTTIQTLFEVEVKAKSGHDKLEWEDWGKFTNFFIEWMTIIHRWPINIIWITHSDAEKTFTLRGDSKNFIPGNSDLLLYSESKDFGPTKPTGYYIHGRRCGQWPARIRMVDVANRPKFTTIGPNPHYDDLAVCLGMPLLAEAEGWDSGQK
jgi:hypothetical protein